jgi:hypothetical protein
LVFYFQSLSKKKKKETKKNISRFVSKPIILASKKSLDIYKYDFIFKKYNKEKKEDESSEKETQKGYKKEGKKKTSPCHFHGNIYILGKDNVWFYLVFGGHLVLNLKPDAHKKESLFFICLY